ncbi:3-ketoacyl-CoA synthase 20-like isoform X2 [Sesamum indicum]|uniref:3-ketoacyl-CoA synthase n=1 Tax=Sesamum indicum TaxID=4182 RepID=A0A8M8V2Q5_SESIN|nr:3-ketoacyl-CoA synthase 20-like isoform X2 [Sesamum indicum]
MAAQNTSPSYHKQPNNLSFSDQLKTYTKLVISKSVYLFIIPAILCAPIHHLSALYFDQTTITQLYKYYANGRCSFIVGFVSLSSLLMGTIYIFTTIVRRPRRVYLVDFACYKHDPSFLISRDSICRRLETVFPPKSAFDCGRGEAETVISGAVGDLLAKTGVNPRDIGVVIVNISTFNPVPSLSAMIVNRYKLRDDVLSYCLGGMGCSAGVIAVDLAKCLLQVRPKTYALVMSLESPTSSYYVGDDRSKHISNCLFRMGGAALLLSNRYSDYQRSKYELEHTVRTHHGADDKAYTCAFQEADDEGNLGLSISKDLTAVAGKALKANIAALGPLVLPISEQLLFLANNMVRKLFKIKGISPYVPDFKLAFDHFCIHTGGKAVLNEVEKNLNLTKWQMEPSRMTLYRYGNTSSSSIWYELAYAEAKGRIQRGDCIWQIAFGTGFKCGSAVWRALRTIDPARADNPWSDVIDHFPINVTN